MSLGPPLTLFFLTIDLLSMHSGARGDGRISRRRARSHDFQIGRRSHGLVSHKALNLSTSDNFILTHLIRSL